MLEDILINIGAETAIRDFYVPEGVDDLNDYFLNQIIAPDNLLKEMPKTVFYTCTEDPIRDFQYSMARRM